MPIVYNRLLNLMKEKKITVYRLRKDKVIGTASMEKILGNQKGHIDTRSIEHLCAYLDCQPGDIMEYVPDEEQKGDFENENEIERN